MNKRSATVAKRKILKAAQVVFTQLGYSRASMRIIAIEAGTSVGGLYL